MNKQKICRWQPLNKPLDLGEVRGRRDTLRMEWGVVVWWTGEAILAGVWSILGVWRSDMQSAVNTCDRLQRKYWIGWEHTQHLSEKIPHFFWSLLLPQIFFWGLSTYHTFSTSIKYMQIYTTYVLMNKNYKASILMRIRTQHQPKSTTCGTDQNKQQQKENPINSLISPALWREWGRERDKGEREQCSVNTELVDTITPHLALLKIWSIYVFVFCAGMGVLVCFLCACGVCFCFNFVFMDTCWAPHLEISPRA